MLRLLKQDVAGSDDFLSCLGKLSLQLVNRDGIEHHQRTDGLSHRSELLVVLGQTLHGIGQQNNAESDIGSSIVVESTDELVGVLGENVERSTREVDTICQKKLMRPFSSMAL